MDEDNIDQPRHRVIVFIDGNNLYHRLKDRGWPTWISIGNLAKRLAGGNRELVRTYYYNAQPPSGAKHEARGRAYLAIATGAPNIVTRWSRLQPIMKTDENGQYRTYIEKGADTAITADMVQCAAANECDIAILVSNDGDFAPPAETLRDYGKQVEVIYFKQNRPFVMENIAHMREFRQSFLQEMDPPRKSRRKPRTSGVPLPS